MSIEQKLHENGWELPSPPPQGEMFQRCVPYGDLIFVAGTGPVLNGQQQYRGQLGADLDVEDGFIAARNCMLNALANLKQYLGSLDEIESVLSLRGFIASANDFYKQTAVLNGASDVLIKLFGEKGRSARAALGVNVLPNNNPVEIELIVKVRR